MVGVGIDGKESMLARVSIVNSFCDTVYDTFVAPMQEVVDYRTEFSGVRPQDLVDGNNFDSSLCCVAYVYIQQGAHFSNVGFLVYLYLL